MNRRIAFLCGLAVLVPVAVCEQTAQTAAVTTPAEIDIRKALELVAAQPDYTPNYIALAIAYARRARETDDLSYLGKAEQTLGRPLSADPDNFEALKVKVFILLNRGESALALELATKINKRIPDDLTVRGYLADANMDLGNYDAAVGEVQWMLNLRSGNAPGLTRGARLRELHGDFAGALQWLHMAYDVTPGAETADRAVLLSGLSRLQLLSGNISDAEKYATTALGMFPDHHEALRTLAEVRLAQNRSDEAVDLIAKRYAAAPRTAVLFALAEALEKAGRKDAAAKAFAEFEQKAARESDNPDNANRELVAYYVDHARQPAKALVIARRELARRHDAFTLDSYAWSLAACGDNSQANIEMNRALAFGIKDPEVLRHARGIAAAPHGIE